MFLSSKKILRILVGCPIVIIFGILIIRFLTSYVKNHLKKDLLRNNFIWQPKQLFFTDDEITLLLSNLESNGILVNNSERFAVDFGINNGEGPSANVFRNLLYRGIAVEGDENYFPALKFFFINTKVTISINFITPKSSLVLLREAGIPKKFNYFKIDLDADDCATIIAVMEGGYRPAVLQVEINFEVPPPFSFVVFPLKKYGYDRHYGFCQCSFSAMLEIASEYGYTLVAVGGTKDMLFVRNEISKFLPRLDTDNGYNIFASCCLAPGNPSNTKQFELDGVAHGKFPPSVWISVTNRLKYGQSQGDFLELDQSLRNYLDAACIKRAYYYENSTVSTCSLPYFLSRDARTAFVELRLATIQAMT